MDPNAIQNPSCWFVLREDQGNVIFSTNNITIPQNSQVAIVPESRYIAEVVHTPTPGPVARQYAPEELSDSSDRSAEKKRKIKDDDNFWDRGRVRLLLSLCAGAEQRDAPAPRDELWNDIGHATGAPAAQCSAKYKHLRRTYLRLLKKKRLGKHIKWIHYATCEEMFTDLKSLPPSALEPWEDAKVRKLLSLYIENLHKFRNPGCLQKDVWRDIASQLGTTGYNCYHKFKNLRRTYWNGLNRSRETGKNTKWSYHQYFERIYYNYKPCAKPWDRYKIKQLLEAYTQIAHKFKNPRLQKKELWKEIAMQVGESPSMCDKKFRNLKQTYVRLKYKANCDRLTTKWRYYKDFELIYSNTTKYIDEDGTPKILYRSHPEEDYKKELLEFYLENKAKFRDPLTKNRSLWKMIAPRLGLTAEECDKHFRNLKQTYLRLAWKQKMSGKCNKWPYYNYFERIYEDGELVGGAGDGAGEATTARHRQPHSVDQLVRRAVRRAVEDAHGRRTGERTFDRLAHAAEDSNTIQRERNRILQALLNRK